MLPWIETVTPGYYQSMETEVLFWIEFSLAIVFELIISSSCFFARKTFYFTDLRALCEGLFFFSPAWELTSFFWNLSRRQYLRFPFLFPVTHITLLPVE